MDNRSAVSIFLFSLLQLILAIGSADSVRTDYGELLANEHVQEKLKLLLPGAVLQNHTIDANEAVNRNCLRDLDLYQRAIKNRELWALKSENYFKFPLIMK